jgi:GNAT superfamily N-acetyltransferase
VIDYQIGLAGIGSADLTGFFDGWPAAPDPDGLLRILNASALAVLARDDGQVVGFANALSDGEFAVYIPLLEVRLSHQHRGIGSELVDQVRRHFAAAYMIDAICDPDVAPFYQRMGFTRLAGMAYRNRRAPILRVAG